jgi:Na+-driven multidrug efflux pump
MPLDRFFGITLDILNKPHLNMMKVFLMLTVNIIADFAGIAIFHNLYGVAIASLFTYYTGLIFGYIQLKKHLNFKLHDVLVVGFAGVKGMIEHMLHKQTKTKTA